MTTDTVNIIAAVNVNDDVQYAVADNGIIFRGQTQVVFPPPGLDVAQLLAELKAVLHALTDAVPAEPTLAQAFDEAVASADPDEIVALDTTEIDERPMMGQDVRTIDVNWHGFDVKGVPGENPLMRAEINHQMSPDFSVSVSIASNDLRDSDDPYQRLCGYAYRHWLDVNEPAGVILPHERFTKPGVYEVIGEPDKRIYLSGKTLDEFNSRLTWRLVVEVPDAE